MATTFTFVEGYSQYTFPLGFLGFLGFLSVVSSSGTNATLESQPSGYTYAWVAVVPLHGGVEVPHHYTPPTLCTGVIGNPCADVSSGMGPHVVGIAAVNLREPETILNTDAYA